MELKTALLLLSVVVATSFAQKKCCYPDQFEIEVSQLAGTVRAGHGSIFTELIQAAWDSHNKLVAGIVTYQRGATTDNFRTIIDYNKYVQYIIYENLKYCNVQPWRVSKMPSCIPDDATYVGSVYYGDHKVTTDIFAYYQEIGQFKGNVTMEVTTGECIPFGADLIGTKMGDPMLGGDSYTGFVLGIKDRDKYFGIPSYCPKMTSSTEDGTFYFHFGML